jgi:hypothetical protein
VRIAPSVALSTFTITVSTITADGYRCPVHEGVVSARQVRHHVEQQIPRAIAQIPEDLDVMVEFELPRAWLTKPVDEWCVDAEERVPMGWSYPVVVRDQGVRSDRRRRALRRWNTLDGQARPFLHAVDCRDARDRTSFVAWLEARADRAVLALANPPEPPDRNPALRAGLYSGVPVMLWSRRRCPDHPGEPGDGPCAGDRFLAALEEALASAAPAEMPELIRQLRAEGAQDNTLEHCGRSLTLFWDDPRRRDVDASLRMAD